MNCTLLDECFRAAGRQTWHIGIDEIQRSLDKLMTDYNLEHAHQGYRLRGRTPGVGKYCICTEAETLGY